MRCLRKDGRHFEDFSREVGEVSHGEYKQWLEDPRVAGEPCDESGDESPNDTDDGPTKGHHKKGGKPFEDVICTQVVFSDLGVRLKHVVQHLSIEFFKQAAD